jgi:hypothetical protein
MFSCMPSCHNGITGSCCNFPPKVQVWMQTADRSIFAFSKQGLQSDPSFAWCAEQPSSFDSRQSN